MRTINLFMVALVFALGAGAGATGMHKWLMIRKPTSRAVESRPASVRMTRDTCCVGEQKDTVHDDDAAHGDHAGDAEHGGADAHADGKLELPDDAMKRFGVQIATAKGGTLEQRATLPGEIVLNADRVAQVAPRVTGTVREVLKSEGDRVVAGELLAVLESRELAEAKAADLSAEARLKLAEANLKRIEGLLKEKVVSERQHNEALQAAEEARIAHRETTAKLHALGLTHDQLPAGPENDRESFGRYEIKAPFAGTLIDRRATLGEVRASGGTMFVLADLSNVWLNVSVYARDAARIRNGAKVRIANGAAGEAPITAEGDIFYVSPTLRESTRTGLARALIDNASGVWRPGMFVTAEVILGEDQADLLVATEAVQTIEGEPTVFVRKDGAFERRPVKLGKSDGRFTQVLSGIKSGEDYVSQGAFILKAEVAKGAGGHEH